MPLPGDGVAAAASDKAPIHKSAFTESAAHATTQRCGSAAEALRNRVPNEVLLGLFGIAAVAGGFAGYASGVHTKRTRWPVLLLGLLVCAVILVILDLDRPSSGFITNNQQAMVDTAAAIAAFPE
jgi:uncharacterized membrane protein YfcA